MVSNRVSFRSSASEPADPGLAEIETAVSRSTQALLAEQREDGHFVFELEADVSIPAEYILFKHFLGEPADAGLEAKLEASDPQWPVAISTINLASWFVSRGRFTPGEALGIVMQAATKNDVSFLQLIESGLHPPYCALEMARFLVGHAAQSTMEIVHVSPATVFHVRQALTVEGQLALVLLNAFLNYGHGRNLLLVGDHTGSR